MLSPSYRCDNYGLYDVLLCGLETRARDYQRTDAHHALDILLTRQAVLLGHEPGLGKCFISFLIAAYLHARRILIVCPAVARLVWQKQINLWAPSWAKRLVVVRPDCRRATLSQSLAGQNAIAVLSYDLFSTNPVDPVLEQTIAGNARFDLCILDEAHYLKSFSAARTQRVYDPELGVAKRSASVLLLSGTPAPNGAQDLYPHLFALWPDLIRINSRHGMRRPMTESEWTERVCIIRHTKFGPRYIGNRDVTRLQRTLEQVMIRRTKRQVLPELPPVIARDIPLDLSILQVFPQLTPETRRLHTKLATAFLRKPNASDILRAISLPPSHPDAPALSSLRRQLAEVKLAAAIEWASPRLDNDLGAKMVFFGWHVEALRRLHKLMAQYNPVLLTGDTNDRDRDAAIERFQTDANCRVFVGQLAACGTAVTLTAGTECVFLECAWTPGLNHQAISRLHRIGKKETVLATFLYAPGTIDETVMHVFRRKASDIRQFIHD